MDPGTATLIAPVIGGIIGKIFGGNSGPSMAATQEQLDILRSITKRATDLYDKTDLTASDARAVALKQHSAEQMAMKMLEQYDASASAHGSSIFKGSTVKDRARSGIAYQAGADVGDFAANLESTRANRKAALLPSPTGSIAGLQGAMAMDNFNNQQSAANQNGLFNLAYLLATKIKFGGSGGGTSGGGYGGNGLTGGFNGDDILGGFGGGGLSGGGLTGGFGGGGLTGRYRTNG